MERASSLNLSSLPKLGTFTISDDFGTISDTQIHDVGLSSLDFLFGRETSSYHTSVSSIPNVEEIRIKHLRVVNMTVQGSGDLAFVFDYKELLKTNRIVYHDISLSGIRNVSTVEPEYHQDWQFSLGNFSLSDSSIENLELGFTEAPFPPPSVVIKENPNLQTVRGHYWSGFGLNDLLLVDNPLLVEGIHSNGENYTLAPETRHGFTWPQRVSNMYVSGPVPDSFL